MEEKIQISFDSTDLAGMIKIMDEHGGNEYPFRGKIRIRRISPSLCSKIRSLRSPINPTAGPGRMCTIETE